MIWGTLPWPYTAERVSLNDESERKVIMLSKRCDWEMTSVEVWFPRLPVTYEYEHMAVYGVLNNDHSIDQGMLKSPSWVCNTAEDNDGPLDFRRESICSDVTPFLGKNREILIPIGIQLSSLFCSLCVPHDALAAVDS